MIQQHFASYLAGAYLGCDVQTLPEAIVHTAAKLRDGWAAATPDGQ